MPQQFTAEFKKGYAAIDAGKLSTHYRFAFKLQGKSTS
jgi:hypothetical protein